MCWRITSPRKLSSIVFAIDELMPAANTVTNTTSASPIISAAAVVAVRPGLRMAFSRARRPVMPRRRSIGRPVTEASGRTSRGEKSDTPNRISTAPPPRSPAAEPESSIPPNSPTSSIARPRAPSTIATIVGSRPILRCSASSDSSSAAIGVMRVARSAGARAASSVTTTPTSSETTIVRGATTVPVLGRSMPTALKSSLIRKAKATPPAMPVTAPSRPKTSASNPTERRICPREAPSVRSMPNSRVRCATVIEKVLKIWKAPTNSETPANTSRAMRRKPRSEAMSSDWRSAASSPVSTTRPGGVISATRSRSSSALTPSSAAIEIWSNLPTRSVIRCASGRITCAMPAPPKFESPSSVRPTSS